VSRGPGRGWTDPYAGMPGRRLFVAVPLPDDAATAVASVVDEVRAAGLPAGMHDVRWVRLDGLHLTLRFLGPTPDDRIPPTAEAIRQAAADGVPIPVAIGDSGAFPQRGRPRTLWVGVVAGAPELDALAARVGERLVAAGWPPDDRPFRAHLTLARSDGLAAGTLVADRLASAMRDRRIDFVADRLTLFESVTGGGPARYVPVTNAAFGARPDVPPDVYHRVLP
jgi:RNA 2',3'-cyclic 3'-phosphodiesterase